MTRAERIDGPKLGPDPAVYLSAVLSLLMFAASCSPGSDAVRIASPPQVSFSIMSLPPPALARPGLRVIFDRRPAAEIVDVAARMPGVAVALRVEHGKVRVRAGGRSVIARVMWVDPSVFRSIASPGVRDAELIWLSLLKGEALVTPATARRLGVVRGDGLVVSGQRIEVAAVADLWSRDAVGIVLDHHIVPRSDTRIELLIGVLPDTSLAELAGRLSARFGNTRIERLGVADYPELPEVTSSGNELIPPMVYRILADGFVAPDPAWVAANISTGSVPLLGAVSCHRLLLPQLRAALAEIEQRGIGRLVDPGDYGGCFVPRFIEHDPERPLSMHAFGLALDLNVSTNAVGTPGDMDPRLVRIMERWGFSWGGWWTPPDPMHFELTALVRI